MQSHDDDSHRMPPEQQDEIMRQIQAKAKRMVEEEASKITAGAPNEEAVFESDMDGIHIRQLPNDEHGVLRISLGRHPAIEQSAYLVYRGERNKVLGLLERAVGALRKISA